MCFSQLTVAVWKGDPLTEGEGPGEGQIVYKKMWIHHPSSSDLGHGNNHFCKERW